MGVYERKWTTLTEVIESYATQEPGITFINGDYQEVMISYRGLYIEAQMILRHLQVAGIEPGHELVLQIRDNMDLLSVFWACLLGRIIPVPLSIGDNDENRLKVFKVWGILKNPHIATDRGLLNKLKVFGERNAYSDEIAEFEKRGVLVDEMKKAAQPGKIQYAKPDDIAFIQFSSGSTGDPKGVVLSHENLMTNLYAIVNCAEWNSEDRILCWMPLTHDMGLIGCHLAPMINQMNQYHMPTSLFIRRPSLWLKKASQHRIAILQSPNFGYKFFLSYFKPETAEEWDLSSVKMMFNGAEPISYDICTMFLDEVEKYGFNRKAIFPVYGLAEATLAVSFPKRGEDIAVLHLDRYHLNIGEAILEVTSDDPKQICFVDEGYPVDDCLVRICDSEDGEVSERTIGHIQIKGKNVTTGYYNNGLATERAITHDGWVRTGDLGFVRNGRLVVTGRAKDIMFVNGLNYYPHDIERLAERVDEIELGKVAVCGVFDSKEQRDQIVAFVVFKKDVNDFLPIVRNLKSYIRAKSNLNLDAVIPISNLPKTTSGKIKRYKLIERYINGEFDGIKESLDAIIATVQDDKRQQVKSEKEKHLVKIFREVLMTEKIDVHDQFLDMGINSLMINQIVEKVHQLWPETIRATDLFSYTTISELAKYLDSQRKVTFPGITLSKPYMTGGSFLRFAKEFSEFSIDGDALNELLGLAEREKVGVDTILVAALAYILFKVSKEREIVLQTMIHASGSLTPVCVNLSDFHYPSHLYRSLDEQTRRVTETIPVESLNHITFDNNHGTIIPFYCRAEYAEKNARVLERQEFVIQVDEKTSEVVVRCDFNRWKLNSGKMRELMFNYGRFVRLMVEQSQFMEGEVVR